MTIDISSVPRLSDEYLERYRSQGSWREQTFPDVFTMSFEEAPDSQVVGPERTLTYAGLAEEVRRVSAGFQELGIEPGDVVSYQLPNWVTTHVVHMAIARIGAVANPIIPIYRRSEVGYILEDADATCVVVPETFREFDYPGMIDSIANDLSGLDSVVVVGDSPTDASTPTVEYDQLRETATAAFEPPSIDPNDIHVLLYTSGTTADPKGVLHTHNTLLCEERNTSDLLGLSAETTVFMPSPVTHVTGLLYALEMPFHRGMDVVLMDQWDPVEAVELIDRHGCNVTVGATPFLQGLLNEAPEDWENTLRVFACGGADVPPDLVRRATRELHCSVQRVYGSTEYPTVTWPPLDAPVEKCATTDGPTAPDAHVKIVDLDTREEVPPGTEGELLAHGPELMVGYLGKELNEDAFDGDWFETGDLAIIDEEGYVEIAGRRKDIIIRGGENIPVKDVEDRLYEHPAIEEVAVVAMPDPEMGEKGCAFVRLAEGASLTFEDMVSYLDTQGIAKQKYPERLELIEAFPKTASGKIQKYELRETVAGKLGREPITRG